LLVGLLRQIGLMQRYLGPHTTEVAFPGLAVPPVLPSVEHDGPAIGTRLPDFVAETVNGLGVVRVLDDQKQSATLLMFMSPLCESCQHIVESLNALVEDDTRDVRPVVIMRADEQATRAFIHVFQLRVPTVSDGDRTIHKDVFAIHSSPFGLFYDRQGTLIRKGVVTEYDDLLALLGEPSAPVAAQVHMIPRPQVASSWVLTWTAIARYRAKEQTMDKIINHVSERLATESASSRRGFIGTLGKVALGAAAFVAGGESLVTAHAATPDNVSIACCSGNGCPNLYCPSGSSVQHLYRCCLCSNHIEYYCNDCYNQFGYLCTYSAHTGNTCPC